ncbi:hypothetical protein D3C85_657570 [compost metagenome]
MQAVVAQDLVLGHLHQHRGQGGKVVEQRRQRRIAPIHAGRAIQVHRLLHPGRMDQRVPRRGPVLAGAAEVGHRREAQQPRRLRQALALDLQGGDQAQVAARRIAADDDPRRRETRRQQLAVGAQGIVPRGGKGVLRRQPVIQRAHRHPGALGKIRGDGAVGGRRAGDEGAAMQVEQHHMATALGPMPLAGAPGQPRRLAHQATRRQGAGRQCAKHQALHGHGHRRPHQATEQQAQGAAQGRA